ncbi:uncharacterized protein HD556DRAFT_1429779 [Suillus plorans]|uniref:Integrase catalytic domain-containing protein n=1 Tax=Suillus plorans TaxID=116603 RepID=A0A9P7DT06_9AGAM|nr:uncharacterized protein HD556DRAFT_1429779 [Suillus plorans]KAG1802206.1 hypothetical protein HD556DRAFT_1429779 [Suillus plorans]
MYRKIDLYEATEMPLVVLGPHHEWSGNGHDKLTQIGFPIWVIRDIWSGKWLSIHVLPNNRLKDAIAYLYLSLCYQLGMPIRIATDCGSETTEMYGFANALCVHNTPIERGWLCLPGSGIYDEMDLRQYQMVWPKLIQQELNQLQEQFNNHRVRKDSSKKLPSDVSPNVAFVLHDKYQAENCLQAVDHEVVRQLMESIGGEDLICFVSVEYENHAQTIFINLGFKELSFHNV